MSVAFKLLASSGLSQAAHEEDVFSYILATIHIRNALDDHAKIYATDDFARGHSP